MEALAIDDFAGRVQEHAQFFKRRVELFDKYQQRAVADLEAAKAANVAISILLPDGTGECSKGGATTSGCGKLPLQLACGV
jgi:hypothetical protein